MMRTLITLFICGLLWAGSLHAQTFKDRVDMESSRLANSYSGGAGSNLVNVDLYTGTGSVNIPIYDYSVSGISLGVSLSYSAKGIKVDELASSVGLGWSLQAGGSITRDAYGLEDEITLPTSYNSAPSDSVEGNLVPGANIDPNYPDEYDDDKEHDLFHVNLPGRSFDVAFIYDGGNLKYETYPHNEVKIQLFTEDWNGSTYTNTRTGIKRRIGIDSNTNILNFTLTDETGNKYYFVRGDYKFDRFEFPTYKGILAQFSQPAGDYYPTVKWDLVKIETYEGFVITYDYAKTFVEYTESVTETLFPYPQEYDPFNPDSLTYDPYEIKAIKYKGYKTHLTKITYPNDVEVIFDVASDTNARCDCQKDFRLKNIIVKGIIHEGTAGGTNQIKYALNQGYFHSPKYNQQYKEANIVTPCHILSSGLTIPSGINVDSGRSIHLSRGLRLKLKSIVRVGTDNSTTEPFYFFEYNNTPLPYRFSAKKDFYGYYNGKTNYPYIRENLLVNSPPAYDTFESSIPYHEDPFEAYWPTGITQTQYWGQNRSHDFDSAQAASLVKIKNCAGGTTELVYTNYTLSNPTCSYGDVQATGWDLINQVPYPINIGCTFDTELEGTTVNDGLCLGKVINSNIQSVEHTSTTEYIYGFGQRFNRGGYTSYFVPQGTLLEVFTNYFVGQDKYVNGSNHGFTLVTVRKKNYLNEERSKTAYLFSNLMYNDSGTLKSWMSRPTGDHWRLMPAYMKIFAMGLPLAIATYDELGNTISFKENEYDTVHSVLPLIGNVRINNYDTRYSWGYLVIDNDRMRLKRTTDKAFIIDPVTSARDSITSVVDYEYDANDNLKMRKWTDSKGDVFKKRIYYGTEYADFLNNSNYALDHIASASLQFPLSEETWKMTGGDSVLIDYSLLTPRYDSSLKFSIHSSIKIKEPLPSSAHFLSSSVYMDVENALEYQSMGPFGTKLERNREVRRYDSKNNELEVQYNDNSQYVYNSSIWDVKTGDRLADVENAAYQDIAFTSFESDYRHPDSVFSMGNWYFDPINVMHAPAGSVTGDYHYSVNNWNGYLDSKLLSSREYVLSLWVKNMTPQFKAWIVNNGAGPNHVSLTEVNTVGDWKLYVGTFHPAGGAFLSFETTAGVEVETLVDEIRLHPVGAVMNSYTYTPLFGIRTKTNAQNIITRYEYDPLGRVTYTRDMRGYVLTKNEISCGINENPSVGVEDDNPVD